MEKNTHKNIQKCKLLSFYSRKTGEETQNSVIFGRKHLEVYKANNLGAKTNIEINWSLTSVELLYITSTYEIYCMFVKRFYRLSLLKLFWNKTIYQKHISSDHLLDLFFIIVKCCSILFYFVEHVIFAHSLERNWFIRFVFWWKSIQKYISFLMNHMLCGTTRPDNTRKKERMEENMREDDALWPFFSITM